MEEKELYLSEKYIKEVIDHVSSSLVGKILKRFEIIEDKNIIKADTKELIYEQFRHLKELFLSYHKGAEFKWQFKSKK